MKKIMISFFTFAFTFLASGNMTLAKLKPVKVEEPFTGQVLTEGLSNPWNVRYGPDNMLWVTERTGKRIVRVNPETGVKKVALTIDEARAEGQHFGVLGMALAPDFLQKDSQNYVYVFYTYVPKDNTTEFGYKKLVRYQYDTKSGTLKNPTVIIDKIPAGDDHNGGRITFGPDGKLYLTLGELGHNQGKNAFKKNEAQRLPTAKEIQEGNHDAYVGKVLRMNPDGSIPEDNPVLNGVKSHIFTYGHRNPQGIVVVENKIFSSEHGPSSDDELNILVSGGNYGWPYVAGFQDNQSYKFIDWSTAPKDVAVDPNVPDPRVKVQLESDWKAPANYKDPIKTFYTVREGYNYHDGDVYGDISYVEWPTVAPSSINYYAGGPMKGWDNSILMTTLKAGTLFRIKLNNQKDNVQGEIATFFHTPNRYRDIAVSPDGKTFYILTDSEGSARDMDLKPTTKLQNPGSILMIKYNGEK